MVYVQVVISGLLIGGVYALLAAGLTLVFGVAKLVNFAHGDLLMLAMYLVYFIFMLLNVHPYLAIPVATAVMFGVGMLTQHFLLRHTIQRGHSAQIVITLGLGTVLQSLALILFSGNYRSVLVKPMLGGSLKVLSISISTSRLAAFLVATLMTVLLLYFLDRTYIGKAVRATAQDTVAAGLMGIPINRIYAVSMGIGTALVGTAGAILAPIFPVYPTIGNSLMLVGFVVVVLGGLGNVLGAYVAGLVIGVVEAVTGLLWGGVVSQIAYFVIFLAILLFRPQGLFQGEAQ